MTNKKYYWLKLKKDFFDKKYIKALRRMPDGDGMVIAYLKMQLASIDSNGRLVYEKIMPDNISEIALDIDEDTDIVAKTLDALAKMGVVQKCDGGDIVLTGFDEMVGCESESAERVRNHRKRKALQCNENVTPEKEIEKDKEIEIETDKEKEKEIETEKETEHPSYTERTSEQTASPSSTDVDMRRASEYQNIVDSFNSICVSLPKVTKLTDSRKRQIRSALKLMDCDTQSFFRKIEASDFLTGREGGWNGCSFDWILKPRNLVKICEGNYDNKKTAPQPKRDYGAAYDIEEFERYNSYDDIAV